MAILCMVPYIVWHVLMYGAIYCSVTYVAIYGTIDLCHAHVGKGVTYTCHIRPSILNASLVPTPQG